MPKLRDNAPYTDFVHALKEKIKHAKSRAVLSVNRQLIELYFDIGREIVSKQDELGWGRSVVEQMAKDLQAEFGQRSGYSSANLWRMRNFYITYADDVNLAQLVRDLPWSHNILIFEKCKDPLERAYYIKNTIGYGWSRNVLTHHIKTELYKRDQEQLKQHNFQNTLPAESSEMAVEMMKSEYNLSFLGISKEAKERELESSISIIENIKIHLNETVKLPHENPAIGIILCTDKDRLEVEYAIGNMNQPLGVATYAIETKLPSRLEKLLPTSDEIKRVLDEK